MEMPHLFGLFNDVSISDHCGIRFGFFHRHRSQHVNRYPIRRRADTAFPGVR